MIFTKTNLPGVIVVSTTVHTDSRGQFLEKFKASEFKENGLNADWKQLNVSLTEKMYTLRGLHYQSLDKNGNDQAQAKLITCLQGDIQDVVVDIRPNSPTFGQYIVIDLCHHNEKSVYIPAGLAHGFYTLSESCIVSYLTSEEYCPSAENGIRFNDPFFKIRLPDHRPFPDDFSSYPNLSEKDANWPDFKPGS